jgi:bifunctional oligoribonuclease and PAP phosphatase NrnA
VTRYDVADWDDVVDALGRARSVAIACHVNPDGDALGAVLGSSLALRKLKKQTYASWGTTPVRVPPAYEFLPGADTLVQPGEVPDCEVFLALDCGAADRLGELESKAAQSRVVVNVDHHVGNDCFGTLNVVVPTASSTAELMTRLLVDAGVELDRDIATCLYAGIVTDTGCFQYSSTTPDVLRLAADLLSHGVPATAIAQQVFESAPFGYLKLVGRVLDRAVLHEDERFVYSWITKGDLADTGVAADETEKLIDLVRATGAADVAAIFKEQPDGAFRVSLRSKGGASVGAIARANGGGGHELAAGFTASNVEDAVAAIRAALRST